MTSLELLVWIIIPSVIVSLITIPVINHYWPEVFDDQI